MTHSRQNRSPETAPKALLVAVKLPEVDSVEFDAGLRELARLVGTLGYQVMSEITQHRATLSPVAVLGEGKLKELAELTGGSGEAGVTLSKTKDKARLRREAETEDASSAAEAADADSPEDDLDAFTEELPPKPEIALIAVDHELSPSQQRNLERATGTQVLDRTGVIIEIFHRHAHSQKARLEVEVARLTYTAPRLRESPGKKERQQGRGAGEAQLELDRRKIRDRIAELRRHITAIQREEGVRRANRQGSRRVALIGYTNAGKSSWMRALTQSQVLVEDKLFATLDTTVRALSPETRPRILVSDTVGFIKKLPHDLVSSFKSTLDEALEASLLLFVVDASDPSWQSQLDVTKSVLSEIGAEGVPSRLLLNKADRLSSAELEALEANLPSDALIGSVRRPDDVKRVRQALVDFFEAGYLEAELVVPYDRQRVVAEMHESGHVLSQKYEDSGVRVRLRADPDTLSRLQSELCA